MKIEVKIWSGDIWSMRLVVDRVVEKAGLHEILGIDQANIHTALCALLDGGRPFRLEIREHFDLYTFKSVDDAKSKRLYLKNAATAFPCDRAALHHGGGGH